MKATTQVWSYVAVLALVAPIGYRAATWERFRPRKIDAAQAQAGEKLFLHDWQPNDPLCRSGDGLGPVFNATSCVACHGQGGNGGGGGLPFNVTMYTIRPTAAGDGSIREGVVHAFATGRYQETLRQAHPQLPDLTQPTLEQTLLTPGKSSAIPLPRGVRLSQRNTPALFGANLIDALPDREIIALERRQRVKWANAPTDSDAAPVGRAMRLPNGRLGKFGWKAQSASLGEFVRAACANELGLGNPGNPQPAPLGSPGYVPPGLDLTEEQCIQLTDYVASLSRPIERAPEGISSQTADAGRRHFHAVGCADCHTPDLGSVRGLYSDLLLHSMGAELEGGGFYYNDAGPLLVATDAPAGAPAPAEWRTPPLWGVADSAPYLHDGRAATLEQAIRLHGGQGQRAAQRFANLRADEQAQLVAFLKTLRAPESR